MSPAAPPPLLALTPGNLQPGRAKALPLAVSRAVANGLRGVVLREPHLPDRHLLTLALEVGSILGGVGGWMCLHDRPHLVGPAAADGVHLGFRSLPVAEAREVIPAGCAVGVSTHLHDSEEVWAGCDYRFFSPVRETPSKAGLVPVSGLPGLRQACSGGLPVYALGGIRPGDVRECVEAGAYGVAALSGILGSSDPGEQARAYLGGFS